MKNQRVAKRVLSAGEIQPDRRFDMDRSKKTSNLKASILTWLGRFQATQNRESDRVWLPNGGLVTDLGTA